MVFKRSALSAAIAVAATPAGFSGVFLAADAGDWAPPNTPGMPGYEEPPKAKDEAPPPIPVSSSEAGSRSYLQREEGGSDR